jgi:cytochrome c biogenesis protein CcdA
MTSRPPGAGAGRYLVLVAAVGLAGLAGYVGYVAYPRFDLPPLAGAGLLVLATGAGVASFFSPCSFPLLLTLLAREVRGGPPRRRLRSALVFAAAFSVGAAIFVLALGALIGLGGRGVAAAVTFTSPVGIELRVAVGLVLVLLGLVQADVVAVSFHALERLTQPLLRRQSSFRRRHPVAGFAAFGFAYLVIGFG